MDSAAGCAHGLVTLCVGLYSTLLRLILSLQSPFVSGSVCSNGGLLVLGDVLAGVVVIVLIGIRRGVGIN